jgi:hypothetical protein
MLTAEVSGLLRQMEETFGVCVAEMAAKCSPFKNIGELCVTPFCCHPYMRVPAKGRRSFHKPTNTYYVEVHADYLSLASSEWQIRVSAYADAVSSGIGRVAKTRLTAEERATLLDIVQRASSEIAATPPPRIAMIGPIYVRSEGTTDGPTLSFGPHPGMIPVMPGEIANHWPDMPSREERLFKLYTKLDGKLHYREAWFSNDATIIEHWGICGERGADRTHQCKTGEEALSVFQRLKNAAREEGFRPIALGKHAKLLVEFPVTGTGSSADLKRRHELEDFLEELVGWLGLGHLDGGSIGSGTMEAMCYVVDFAIAKAAVESALRESSFSDFSRIYRETD